MYKRTNNIHKQSCISVLKHYWQKFWQFSRKRQYRSRRPEVFCKKGVLKNFTKFTGKQLCQSLFFNKVAGLKPAILLKKRLWNRCFPVNFVKFLRTHLFTDYFQWLLLSVAILNATAY